MNRRRGQARLSSWQRSARDELRALGREFPDDITVELPAELVDGVLHIDIALDTSGLRPPAPGGLVLEKSESFVIAIPEHTLLPPQVGVHHARFLGSPHVLGGSTLCLYLDAAREWQPAHGMRGLINRLWAWLDDAAMARFDPSNALYHAVGGLLHASSEAPTIVVRHSLDDSVRVANGHLVRRTPQRYDHRPGRPADANGIPMPVIMLPHNLPFGAGRDRLIDLLQRLDYADRQALPTVFTQPCKDDEQQSGPAKFARKESDTRRCGFQRSSAAGPSRSALTFPIRPTTAAALLTTLAASAARQPDGTPQYVLLGVPHPQGGPPHILSLRFPASVGDALRRAVSSRTSMILDYCSSDVPAAIAMEWCPVSDERPEVTVRRDSSRPVNVLHDKVVHVWGCGGLGSWMAEFAVRAGVKKLVICDPSRITGGLLVRQNFIEDDIGSIKASGLAERLRAISDTTEVEAHTGMLPADLEDVVRSADLVIDATISLAVAQVVVALTAASNRRATLAQIATDSQTGTLGLAIVATPGCDSSVQQIDAIAGSVVAATAELEDYRVFWAEPGVDDELTPTRGCSAPTFHGSAADMAAIAGTLLSVVGLSLQAGRGGAHLVALPHSGVTPSHRYIPSTLCPMQQ